MMPSEDPYEYEVPIYDSESHGATCVKLLAGAWVVAVLILVCVTLWKSRLLNPSIASDWQPPSQAEAAPAPTVTALLRN